MQYRLNGRLLFAENEDVTGRIYTHAVCRGDQVIRIHTSLEAAEADLAGEQAEAAAYGRKLRDTYDRRRAPLTNLNPDPGNVVRGRSIDAMFPTLRALKEAIEAQAELYRSLHVAPLELSGANNQKGGERRARRKCI